MLTRFDETGIQLLSIFLTVIILCIAIPIFAFGPTENSDFYVLVICLTIFLVGNVVILLNLCPRICTVIRNKQDEYMKSPSDKLADKIQSHLKRYTSQNTEEFVSSNRTASTRSKIRIPRKSTASKPSFNLNVSSDALPVSTPSIDFNGSAGYTTEEDKKVTDDEYQNNEQNDI